MQKRVLENKDYQLAYEYSQYLHNIPSLIGCDNVHRHLYFFNAERLRFIEFISQHLDAEESNFTLKSFLPLWLKLIDLIYEEFPA